MAQLFADKELRELLIDLRSVKMRDRIDRIQAQALEHKLVLSNEEIREAWVLVRRYRKKLIELHDARERARVSRGRQALGLSLVALAQRCAQREADAKVREKDLGL